MDHVLTISKIDKEISEIMPVLAESLSSALNSVARQQTGFVLVVMNSEPGSIANYVSNCERESVVDCLKMILNNIDTQDANIPDKRLH